MSIAIVVLQTGERVITDLLEVREDNKEDGKPVCLLFQRPYILTTESTDSNITNQEVQVRFSKWLPYSSDVQFKIPFGSIMAVGGCDPGLQQAYQQTIDQAIAAEEQAGITTATQNPPPAASTGVVPAGTGFGGETNSDPHGVGEFSVETHSDDEDTTLPDGSVDLDLEDQSDGQFNSDVDISDPKNDQNTTT